MPMQMRDRENGGTLGLHDEEQAERKPVENGSPTLPKDDRKTRRSFLDPRERRTKFSEEFHPEAFPFTVVPRSRLESIKFSLRPNLQQRHLPTGAEPLLHSFNHLWPRSGFFRGAAMGSETLFQKSFLPLLERDLVDTRRDVIPERLHVVDLIFDRKRVEPEWRHRQGM
jgi:hypothetical protein